MYIWLISFVQNQMHVRMGVVGRLISISVSFYMATLATIVLYLEKIVVNEYFWILVFALVPFFIIAMLIAREDNLMLSHDEYLYKVLRPAILKEIDEDPDTSKTMTFLNRINDYKVGGITSLSSVFRYTFPVLGMLSISITGWVAIDAEKENFIILASAITSVVVTFFVLYQLNVKNKNIYSS